MEYAVYHSASGEFVGWLVSRVNGITSVWDGDIKHWSYDEVFTVLNWSVE